ncbi:hypothetical protein QZM46_09015 [Burkholderia vietnamiensis]|jgi:hypothetical protein|uniref:Uncharacterized protein n=1 Tax=Burkholderia vietnamiensis TaxID=60552 RepID=A0A103J4L0_BURVI|nr:MULTISPECIES: hypothetical protein [Burkholderia]TPQ31240.1 hypothetical protein C2U71_31135 [Burkholderia ubonensis]AFJ88552.1 hypothetical protein MYA_4195 [Burkholderia sp. KJ006]AOJ15926.1 hypothetical protein WJ02_20265 [Burkholderia vietnamiensis]AOJ98678.1 hypothetical protein WK23_08530 [Burkholderia vietnamiensis]AOK43518.1 hypothetical protein WL96_20770 [Burkholderia vietnamiensis]
MKTTLRLRVAVIASAFAVYHVFMHVQWIVSGCIEFLGSRRCSFENDSNFERMMNVDLLLTCAWTAGAAMAWFAVARARRKAG